MRFSAYQYNNALSAQTFGIFEHFIAECRYTKLLAEDLTKFIFSKEKFKARTSYKNDVSVLKIKFICYNHHNLEWEILKHWIMHFSLHIKKADDIRVR